MKLMVGLLTFISIRSATITKQRSILFFFGGMYDSKFCLIFESSSGSLIGKGARLKSEFLWVRVPPGVFNDLHKLWSIYDTFLLCLYLLLVCYSAGFRRIRKLHMTWGTAICIMALVALFVGKLERIERKIDKLGDVAQRQEA